jgi:hypothetical protein
MIRESSELFNGLVISEDQLLDPALLLGKSASSNVARFCNIILTSNRNRINWNGMFDMCYYVNPNIQGGTY